MPYFFLFLWDEVNEQHIAEHGLTPEEFEYVVLDVREADLSRSSGRPMVIGYTEAGRKICCVYDVEEEVYCYPITAYDVE
jgi:uncharacterized DUF497 family protein